MAHIKVFVMLVCGDLCSPFLRWPHFYVPLLPWWHCGLSPWLYSELLQLCYLGRTSSWNRSVCWLLCRIYRWYGDDNYSECFNMQLTSAGSPFLLQSPNKGAPPTPPLPLLFHPKALTSSSSNQIPATVQWRGAISDNAIAACLSERTYCM